VLGKLPTAEASFDSKADTLPRYQQPISKMKFPLWQYLKQPVFSTHHKVILNPRKFWQQSTLSYLERCWVCDYQSEERYH